MKRRHFLTGAAAGLAAAAWPAFIQEAFGNGPACDANGKPAKLPRAAVVAAAFQHARRAGRSLLVLVIPDDDAEKYERGRAFGELLNHGSDADLAPLAGVEVVCATIAELRKVVPQATDTTALMMLVRTDRVPVDVKPLSAQLPTYEDPRLSGADWQTARLTEDDIAKQRIALLGALLRGALGDAGKDATAKAALIRDRLVKLPPAGARWAKSHGCGTTIEGEERDYGIGCGMGHVPEKSRRFLYFFTGNRPF